jgi:HD-like signal output (HDOD) protein
MSLSLDFDSILHKIAAELKKNELLIPSMPELVINLSKQINNNDVTVKELANIITSDTSVASQLVRLSQTLRYSNPGTTITSLPNAISRIGLSSSISISLALAIEQTFEFKTPILKNYCKEKIVLSNLLCRIALTMCKIKYVVIPPLIFDYIMLGSALLNIGTLPFMAALDNFFRNNKDLCEINLNTLEEYVNSIKEPLAFAILRYWKFDPSFELVVSLKTDAFSEFYVNSIPYANLFYKYAIEKNIKIQSTTETSEMFTPFTEHDFVEQLKNWMDNEPLLGIE